MKTIHQLKVGDEVWIVTIPETGFLSPKVFCCVLDTTAKIECRYFQYSLYKEPFSAKVTNINLKENKVFLEAEQNQFNNKITFTATINNNLDFYESYDEANNSLIDGINRAVTILRELADEIEKDTISLNS